MTFDNVGANNLNGEKGLLNQIFHALADEDHHLALELLKLDVRLPTSHVLQN